MNENEHATAFNLSEFSYPQAKTLLLKQMLEEKAQLEKEVARLSNPLLRQEAQREARQAKRAERDKPPSFYRFAQSTYREKFDLWQTDLCHRLQEVFEDTKARKVLICVHPQAGKTILISQRFPAYCIGRTPSTVIKLAMYNQTHAIRKGGKVVRDLVQSPKFKEFFPDPACALPRQTSAQEWSTLARLAVGDGQPSFMSMGLASGFTGEGADWLFIDDPYADAADARSEAYHQQIVSFWTETAKPRLKSTSKVVVMYHRYGVDDFGGYLLANEPDDWEVWRYAAIADEPYEVEETGKIYPAFPLNRPFGKKLSPRFSWEWYNAKMTDNMVWLGQFQGRPTRKDGTFFDLSVLRQPNMLIDEWDLPPNLTTVRAWDFAATEGGGAHSAGVKICGPDNFGFFYITDCLSAQMGTPRRMKTVQEVAEADGEHVETGFPVDPGSAGKDTAWFTVSALGANRYWTFPTHQDKVTRAEPLQRAWNAGRIKLVRGAWIKELLKVFRQFPVAKRKDEVDATAEGYKRLEKLAKRGQHRPKSTSQTIYS